MEDGGNSFFEFVMKSHQLILAKRLKLENWKKISKIIFRQMVESIAYIHCLNVAHFDISLENFLINDIQIELTHTGDTKVIEGIEYMPDGIQIKLADFGT